MHTLLATRQMAGRRNACEVEGEEPLGSRLGRADPSHVQLSMPGQEEAEERNPLIPVLATLLIVLLDRRRGARWCSALWQPRAFRV